MAQIITQKQQLRQAPSQMLLSKMVESTSDDLLQLINEEVEKNFTLETSDSREMSIDGRSDGDDNTHDTPEDDAGGTADNAPDEALRQDTAKDEDAFFEYDDDSPSDRIGHRSPDDEDFNPGSVAVSEESFREDLKDQIAMLDITEEERFLANYIIDSIEDDGYLHRPLAELVDDLEFTQNHTTTEEDLEAVLVEIVQEELEPSGIGARNLRECLLLQLLDRKATPATRLAYAIIDQAFEDLTLKHYDRLQEGFGVDRYALVDAIRVIRHLNPKPGNMKSSGNKSAETRVTQVRPDFIVRNEDGTLVVTLNDGHLPEVRISTEQEQLLAELQQKLEKKTDATHENVVEEERQAVQLLRENIRSGTVFIDALRQRRITLVQVMQTIVQMQRAYFLTGQIETLRPMVLQDVADRCGYDISTISRVSNSKYVDTDFGIISVKELFSTAISASDDNLVSNVAVMEALREIIMQEDKHSPLTDEKLSAMLKEQGYPIARRTVMKYREKLGFPVARMRKEL